MKTVAAVPMLSALAQDSRLAIFRWLVELGPTGACPADISERLVITPTTLSFHLKSLQQAGLVRANRSGRSITYVADFEAMRSLIEFLTRNCCGGDPARCLPAEPSVRAAAAKTSSRAAR